MLPPSVNGYICFLIENDYHLHLYYIHIISYCQLTFYNITDILMIFIIILRLLCTAKKQGRPHWTASPVFYALLFYYCCNMVTILGINCFFLDTSPFNIISSISSGSWKALLATSFAFSPKQRSSVSSFTMFVSMI